MIFFRPEKKTDQDQISIDRILQYIELELNAKVYKSKDEVTRLIPRKESLFRSLFFYLSLKYTNESINRIEVRLGLKSHSAIDHDKKSWHGKKLHWLEEAENRFLLRVFKTKNSESMRVKNWENKVYGK